MYPEAHTKQRVPALLVQAYPPCGRLLDLLVLRARVDRLDDRTADRATGKHLGGELERGERGARRLRREGETGKQRDRERRAER